MKSNETRIKPQQEIISDGRVWLSAFRLFILVAAAVTVIRMFSLQNQLQLYLSAALKSRDEAVAATRLKAEFASTMSHEIRTPLSAIVGFSEMMIDEPTAEIAEIIHSQSKKLLQIVNDILDFSKLESGMITNNLAPLSLSALLDNILRATSTAAAKNETAVSYKIVGDDTVSGDEVKLNQILLNIVSNAIKFSSKGSVVITVTNSSDLKFEVKDDGIGIAASDLNKLFKPFSQVDNSNTRKFGGTGLGLSICKKLVEVMGGSIYCTSDKGSGSSFSFQLPKD